MVGYDGGIVSEYSDEMGLGWKWGDFEPGGVGKYEMGWKCGVFQPIFMDDTPERGRG